MSRRPRELHARVRPAAEATQELPGAIVSAVWAALRAPPARRHALPPAGLPAAPNEAGPRGGDTGDRLI